MEIDEFAQRYILVSVQFYDAREEANLLRYPEEAVVAMKRMVADPIEVSTSEFLTYFLFHRMGRDVPGYENVESIQKDLSRAASYIDQCLHFSGGSIRLPSVSAQPPADIVEHVGEAIGLAVVSRIHGLTEADWARLPVKKHPDNRKLVPSFDFQASDATRVVQSDSTIQVETKGTAVEDNRKKTSQISKQKADIRTKKRTLATLPEGQRDPYPAAVRYGTVTAIDGRDDGIVRCRLVDPDPEGVDQDPRKVKLLTRLRFLTRWIGIVSPKSQLAATLATRVNDVENLLDPFELAGIPLLRGNSEPFTYPLMTPEAPHSSFFANKTRVTDGPAGGIAVQVAKNILALVGIHQDLVTLAAEQDFDRILNYEAEAGTLDKAVEFVFPSKRFRDMGFPGSIVSSASESGGQTRFTLHGATQYNRSGLVFGFYRISGWR